jgi:gliding motility-associated-like protein
MIRLCFYRRTLVALTILVLATLQLSAQLNPPMGSSPWGFANPKPIGYSLLDMSFINDNNGLAVGTNGGIIKTTDGGRNWVGIPYKYVTPANVVTLGSFADVQFVTPSIAYAVGSGGLMVKSTDGGINWSPLITPLTALAKNINALHFINKDTGYIGGAAINTTNTTSINDAPKVYFTKNGGATWDSLVSPFRPQQNAITLSGFNSADIHRIHFVNDSVGYVSGSCGQSVPNYSAILWKIEKNVVKDYSIHRTKFGITATTGSYTPATQTFKGLVAINDSLVLISSLNNNVVIRVKTGKNDSTANAVPATYGAYEKGVYEIVIWLASTATPFPANLVSGVAGQMQQLKKSGNKIFLTCGNSILTSTDNGTTWAYTKPHPASVLYPHWTFNALDITPNGRIVAGTFNGLTYDSLPGSTGWQTVYKNERPLFYAFNDMDWADICNGIAVGSNGSIIKTSDGGKTWVNNSNPIFDAAQISLGYVQYKAANNMIFTAGASIYQSTDQGTSINNTLFTDPNVNSSGITGFTMIGLTRAFAISYRFSPSVDRTVIFRSLNANAASPTWDTVKTFPQGTLAPQLRNIKFANQDTGYVCGTRGKVYRTINGGNTWTDISPDTTINSNGTTTYTGLSVVDGKTVFITGSSRKFFRSTDAGQTWTDLTLAVPTTPSPINSFTALTNIIMNDATSGYIQAGGTLLKTTDSWATYSFDLAPGGMNNIFLYPKITGPISGKKLYAMPLSAGSPVNSTNTAFLTEYGTASLTTMTSTEAATDANCTNPNGGTITVTTTGGIAPYSYSINGGAFQSSNVFSGLNQGVKTVLIKDASCQSFTKTITIGFTDNLTLSTNNDTTVCSNAPVQMVANSNAASYVWTPSAGLSSATISNPIALVNSNTSFTVTATLNSCIKTRTITIQTKPSPAIDAGPDKTIVAGDQVMLDGLAINPVSIAWTPASSLSNANILNPVAKPLTTTTYVLTVKNSDNCTSIDNATVTVLPYCIKAMEAFTPNGDAINDRWLVTAGNSCTSRIYVDVFNRYGNLIYRNENYQNDWDGTWHGKPVADGTYYYVITYLLINGKSVMLKGNVTILR